MGGVLGRLPGVAAGPLVSGAVHCADCEPLRDFRDDGVVLAWVPENPVAGGTRSVAALARGLLLYKRSSRGGDGGAACDGVLSASTAGTVRGGIDVERRRCRGASDVDPPARYADRISASSRAGIFRSAGGDEELGVVSNRPGADVA